MDDIQDKLEKISATTNVYPQPPLEYEEQTYRRRRRSFSSGGSGGARPQFQDSGKQYQLLSQTDGKRPNIPTNKKGKSEIITEVRVPGNVTGILIPNTENIDIRVVVAIRNGDEELDQDLRYVKWETV